MKKILIVDDEKDLLDLYDKSLQEIELKIFTAESAEKGLNLLKETTVDMIISDVKMSGISGIDFLCEVRKLGLEIPFLLVTAFSNVKDAVKSLKLGAVDYLEKPIDLSELLIAVKDNLGISQNISLGNEIPKEVMNGIIAENNIMRSLYYDAYRVAETDATVLITGESGTGKEVLADFIHKNSLRNSQNLISVNCASISPSLLASELFGHKKGSFTGAISDRSGFFREANKGTIFLDEIGDMQIEQQASLLRVLENKMIIPVGSEKEVPIDARLIAATNCNFKKAIKNGTFREDLYYRLNIISFEIPPLRERPEDIQPLVRLMLKKQNSKKRISSATLRILQQYNWPGNIRELNNVIQRVAILARTEIIMPTDLPKSMQNTKMSDSKNDTIFKVKTLHQRELEDIKKTLELTKGNQTKAAELLGISRKTLINKLKLIINVQ